MTRKAHFLTPLKSGKNPDQWIFYDTETKPVQIDEKTTKHVLKLGFATYKDYRYERDFDKQDSVFFTDNNILWDFVEGHARDNITLWMCAHNVNFDALSTELFEIMPARGWQITKFIVDNGKVIVDMKKERKKIRFFDSFNLMPTSLESIGEAIGESKGHVEFETVDDEQLAIYCKQDVKVLQAFITQWMHILQEHDFGKIQFTTASQAFAIFRYKYMKTPIAIHDNEEAIRMERDSYKGGRTEAYFIGKVNEKLAYLDINSMYPHCMRSYTFPTKLVNVMSDCSTEDYIYQRQKYLIIADCEIETTENCVGIKGERFLFPIGRFSCTLTSAEIDYLLEHNQKVKVTKMALYEHDFIFKDFVEDIYNLRLEAKKKGLDAYVMFYKRMLNSLYGKFGQRAKLAEIISDCELDIVGSDHYYDLEDCKYKRIRCVGGKIIHEENTQEESFNSFPAIASFVTAYARMLLWKYIKTAGRENVYYVDTDSLFVNAIGEERLKQYIDEDKLGYLKHEKPVESFEIYGVKDYILNGEQKTKGISKNMKLEKDGKYHGWRFQKIIGAINDGDLSGVKVINVVKELKREYKKGTVNQDGSVAPFEFG